MMYRTLSDPVKYGYGVGRVKVLESKLLNAQRLERLVEADGFSQALHILHETEYGHVLEGAETQDEVEKALDEYGSQVYEFLRETGMGGSWLSFFLVRRDMHNLKVALKNHFLGGGLPEVYFPPGRLDLKLVEEALRLDALGRLPAPFARAALRAKEKYEASRSGQLIDLIIDQEMYEELYRLAFAEKRKFLKDFVAASIDIANLKIFVRSKILEKGPEFLSEVLINHGEIPGSLFLSLYANSWEGVLSRLALSRYSGLFSEGWREALERSSLNHFDTVADNFLLELAKHGKRVSLGPEPIFGYILAKESEIKIIRIILIGKLAGLSKKIIKERMRNLYV